jgi:hypothetical protein
VFKAFSSVNSRTWLVRLPFRREPAGHHSSVQDLFAMG